MKKSELFFSFLSVPIDYLMLVLAGIAAYYTRFSEFTQGVRPVIFNLPLNAYLPAVFLVGVLWVILFALSGLYSIRTSRKYVREIYKVVEACSLGLALIVIMIFFRREFFDSRFIVLAAWLYAILFVIVGRGIIRYIQRSMYGFGVGIRKVIIVGAGATADNLIKEFSSNQYSGFEVVKRVRDFELDTENELSEFIKSKEIDEIIQADPNLKKPEVMRLFDFADFNHLVFKYAADLLDAKVLRTEVAEISGIPVVEVIKTPLDGWGRIAKRIFDIIFSVIFLIIFSPLMILVAFIIKLDSTGPIFYLDYRTGQYNKKFIFYKFRSMIASLCDGEGPGGTQEGNKYLDKLEKEKNNLRNGDPLHKIKDDPRVTRFGRFIRKWSIDELPQLFNVLKGDISLVGPRPHMTLETAKYENRHRKIFTIKPGITGLAQISGRSDLSFEEEVRLDTYYIENWNMLIDLGILLRTPLAVVRPRKAE